MPVCRNDRMAATAEMRRTPDGKALCKDKQGASDDAWPKPGRFSMGHAKVEDGDVGLGPKG